MRKKEKYNKAENGEGLFFKVKTFISDCFYSLSVMIHQFFAKFSKKKKEAGAYTVEECKKQKRIARIKELLCIWSVLIIPLLNLFLFWVIGTLESIPIAFEYYPQSGGKEYTLWNFKYLWQAMNEPGSIFMNALTNTLKYWAVGWFIIMPFSYITSFFFYKKMPGYKFFRYVFYMPGLISSIIISSVFMYMVAPGGLVPTLAEKVFGIEGLMLLETSDTAFGTLIFYQLWTGLVGQMVYWIASYSRIPQEVSEAAQLDGVSYLGEFWHISYPITKGFFWTMQMLNLTGILMAGGAALLLTDGNYGTYDLGFFEYKMTISGSQQSQAIAGAVGLVKGIVVLPLALVVNHFIKKIETVEM